MLAAVPAFDRSVRREFTGVFVRSALTSALATGSDFVVANGLVASGVSAPGATSAGYVLGGLVAFGLNRGWAFRVQGRPGPQLLRFLGVWLSSAALNVAGVALLLAALGWSFAVAWALVRGLVFSAWNYPLLRWFVFPDAPGAAPVEPPR